MKKLLLVLLALVILSGFSFAQTDSSTTNSYVSLKGNFSIDYPSDWKQIPFVEFDAYLASKRAGRPIYDYDAVFAATESDKFYLGSYFIISLDLGGKYTDKQIDSTLKDLAEDFGNDVKYFPVANFKADMESDAPSYDKATKTVSIYNKIVQNEQSIKNSLILMKFYDFGLATFYCYGIGDEFEKDVDLFNNVVASLSSEDIKSKLPKQQFKVADIDTSKNIYSDSDDDSSNVAIYVSLGVVLFIVLMRKRRKKNS